MCKKYFTQKLSSRLDSHSCTISHLSVDRAKFSCTISRSRKIFLHDRLIAQNFSCTIHRVLLYGTIGRSRQPIPARSIDRAKPVLRDRLMITREKILEAARLVNRAKMFIARSTDCYAIDRSLREQLIFIFQ